MNGLDTHVRKRYRCEDRHTLAFLIACLRKVTELERSHKYFNISPPREWVIRFPCCTLRKTLGPITMQSHIQLPACQTDMNYATLKLVVCSLKVLGSLIWWGRGVFKDRTNVCDVRMKLEEHVTRQVKKNEGTAADSKSWLLVSHLPFIIYLCIYMSVYWRFIWRLYQQLSLYTSELSYRVTYEIINYRKETKRAHAGKLQTV